MVVCCMHLHYIVFLDDVQEFSVQCILNIKLKHIIELAVQLYL